MCGAVLVRAWIQEVAADETRRKAQVSAALDEKGGEVTTTSGAEFHGL